MAVNNRSQGLSPKESFVCHDSCTYSSGKKSLYFVLVERSLHNAIFTVLFNVAYTWITIIIMKNVILVGESTINYHTGD